MTEVRVGMKFLHKRVLDENNQPAVYVVTKIQGGIIYYKQPAEKKAKQCSYMDEFITKYFLKEI